MDFPGGHTLASLPRIQHNQFYYRYGRYICYETGLVEWVGRNGTIKSDLPLFREIISDGGLGVQHCCEVLESGFKLRK